MLHFIPTFNFSKTFSTFKFQSFESSFFLLDCLYMILWHSGLGSYFVCKRLAVQNLLQSLEFAIQINLKHETIKVSNLAESWSILICFYSFLRLFWILCRLVNEKKFKFCDIQSSNKQALRCIWLNFFSLMGGKFFIQVQCSYFKYLSSQKQKTLNHFWLLFSFILCSYSLHYLCLK